MALMEHHEAAGTGGRGGAARTGRQLSWNQRCDRSAYSTLRCSDCDSESLSSLEVHVGFRGSPTGITKQFVPPKPKTITVSQ